MKPADDSAVNTTATPGVRSYPHRPRGAVLVMVLAASLAALLPSAVQAHGPVTGTYGTSGSAIDITPDGYSEPFYPRGRDYTVDGTGFGSTVVIFQCPVSRQSSIHRECQPLGAARTLAGNFSAEVHMLDTFVSVAHPAGACFGRDYTYGDTRDTTVYTQVGDYTIPGTDLRNKLPSDVTKHVSSFQCSVVAATFGTTAEITHMAEHYICFEGANAGTEWHNSKCVQDPATTTTTTSP